MKINIETEFNIFSRHWILAGDGDICGICQLQFDMACPSCIYPGINCPIITGDCKHSFHNHCIQKWLFQLKEIRSKPPDPLNPNPAEDHCPMCRRDWNVFL